MLFLRGTNIAVAICSGPPALITTTPKGEIGHVDVVKIIATTWSRRGQIQKVCFCELQRKRCGNMRNCFGHPDMLQKIQHNHVLKRSRIRPKAFPIKNYSFNGGSNNVCEKPCKKENYSPPPPPHFELQYWHEIGLAIILPLITPNANIYKSFLLHSLVLGKAY